MRVPFKTETDAFRVAAALGLVLALSLIVGALSSLPYGVVVFAAGCAAGVVFELAGRETPEHSLRDAAAAPHPHEAGPGKHHILVIAERALGGDELRRQLQLQPGAEVEIDVLAPVMASRAHHWAGDVDRELAQAQARLEASLAWAAEQGFVVKGEVGDHDAMAAIEDELRRLWRGRSRLRHPTERAHELAGHPHGQSTKKPAGRPGAGNRDTRRTGSSAGPARASSGIADVGSPPSTSPLTRARGSCPSLSWRTHRYRRQGHEQRDEDGYLDHGETPSTAAVDPTIAAGAHDFVQFACGQCHGLRGQGGVSPAVPALSGVAQQLTPAELRSIINHGLGESSNPTKPYMPVWGTVMSSTQVNDLVAYLRAGLPAVPTAEPPPLPENQGAAVEGGALYIRYGCVNCHGINGLGGVPNPKSPDKTIPPLSGPDFRKEFNTEQKIVAVIRSGSVIGKPPIVSMPHWGGIIPNQHLRALVAYLNTLK